MTEFLGETPGDHRRFRVFMPREIELPEDADRSLFKRVVSVD
jgi:hypothetical protein